MYHFSKVQYTIAESYLGCGNMNKVLKEPGRTGEKVARCPFLHPEGVHRYSERGKKGQNNAKNGWDSMSHPFFLLNLFN